MLAGRAVLRKGLRKLFRVPTALLLVLLRAYQLLISPLLPPACRFEPTCSNYAMEAVRRHGVVRGGWLAGRRLLKCHPFHAGGFDPVPGDHEH